LRSFSYYACVQVQLAANTSIFSLFCLGLSRSKGLLCEGKNYGPKDRAELQEYIGKPLARSTVDAYSDGKKY